MRRGLREATKAAEFGRCERPPGDGPAHFYALVEFAAPLVQRMSELELNGAARHLRRIRSRKWNTDGRLFTLSVNGTIASGVPPRDRKR